MKAYTVDARRHPRFKPEVDICKGGTALKKDKNNNRRSTRLTRQIAITITSLDLAYDFRVECTTVVVNAHGCGVIIREQLMKDTLVAATHLSQMAGAKRVALCLAFR